jgi:hypothetical protein
MAGKDDSHWHGLDCRLARMVRRQQPQSRVSKDGAPLEGWAKAQRMWSRVERIVRRVHHIRRLADDGPDHPRWVAALCPDGHRRLRYGADGAEFNRRVANKIGVKEPS